MCFFFYIFIKQVLTEHSIVSGKGVDCRTPEIGQTDKTNSTGETFHSYHIEYDRDCAPYKRNLATMHTRLCFEYDCIAFTANNLIKFEVILTDGLLL